MLFLVVVGRAPEFAALFQRNIAVVKQGNQRKELGLLQRCQVDSRLNQRTDRTGCIKGAVETGISWPKIRRQMQQLNLIEFLDKNGRVLQHTELTPDQRNILNKLKIKPPRRVLKVDLAA